MLQQLRSVTHMYMLQQLHQFARPVCMECAVCVVSWVDMGYVVIVPFNAYVKRKPGLLFLGRLYGLCTQGFLRCAPHVVCIPTTRHYPMPPF